MKKLDTVEDYIDALYEGSSLGFGMSTNYQDPVYRLASYDKRIIQSIHSQVNFQSIGLTDKQSELCIKLIEKYTRQFVKQGIDNTDQLDSSTRKYRLKIRKIDRSLSVTLEDDQIHIKFPYNLKMISLIRNFGGKTPGRADWDRGMKVWKLDLTEPYIQFAVELGQNHDFDIDPDLLELYNTINSADLDKHRIQLVKSPHVHVRNAPRSLEDYLTENVPDSDLIKLIDHAGVCQYEVSQELQDYVNLKYNTTVAKCLLGRHIWAEPKDTQVLDIFDYADLTDRFPITVYSTLGSWYNTKDHIHNTIYSTLFERYGPIWHDHELPDDWIYKNPDRSEAKVRIYSSASKIMFDEDIPLCITMQNFNFGSLRMLLFEKCQKIVYNCIKL